MAVSGHALCKTTAPRPSLAHCYHCCVRRRRSLAGPSPIRGVTVIALRRFLTAKLGRETLQAVMHLPGYPTHHMLDFFDPRLTYDQSVQDTAVFTCVSCMLPQGALLPAASPACPWHDLTGYA